MLLVIGPEPSFNLALRGGFTDAPEDVSDALLFTVRVEAGFASSNIPELGPVVGEDLSRLMVFLDGSVQ